MIEVDVAKRDEWVVDLNISVDKEGMAGELDAAYKEFTRTAKLPGFRRGKAPRSVLEERAGPDIERKAIERLLPKVYEEAVGQANIAPITPPQIDNIDYKKDEYLKFRAQVEVKPEITIEDYKRIELSKKIKKVGEEEVEKELENLQKRNAEMVGVETRPAKENDVITINYEGFVDGAPIPGARAENVSIEIGKTKLLPGAEDELIGMEIDTSREIKINLPPEYPAKEFAGQEATFKIELKSIKEKRLPAIDDEFAKDVGRTSLAELKKGIKNDLENFNEDLAKAELKNEILKTLISKASFSPPRGLLEKEIDLLINEFKKNLAPSGLTLDKYLAKENVSLEKLRGDFRPRAVEQLKGEFILDTIADKEDIQASEEELEEQINRMAKILSKTPREMRDLLGERGELDGLRQRVRIDKTLNFLLEAAEIKEVYE